MANAIDLKAAMAETKPAGFAKAINVDPKRLRSYLRGSLKVRVSDGDAFTDEAKTALIEHFVPKETSPKGKKGSK